MMKAPANPYSKQWQLLRRLKSQDPERLFGVERWFCLVLAAFLMLMPGMCVRWLGGLRGYLGQKRVLDAYAVAKPCVLLLVLAAGRSPQLWAAVLAAIMLADLYSYVLGLVFLRHYYSKPASYGRSVILLGVNFVEGILGFSVLYLHANAIGRNGTLVTSWSDAVYFSVITAATVGYGDVTPLTDMGRLLVVLQVLASFVFVVVILAAFVSGLRGEGRRGLTRS